MSCSAASRAFVTSSGSAKASCWMRLAARIQTRHGPVQNPVRLGIKVLRIEHLPDHRNGRLGDEHRPYHGPLGVEVVRRHPGVGPRRYPPYPPPTLHIGSMQQKGPRYKTEPLSLY